MEGWVSIHRKITQWQWYSDANTARVFIHLLIMANHSDGFYQGHTVKRGQRITSPDKIAIELGLSRQKVRTALDKLILTNEITIKATTKFSLVTIEKYEFYQSEQKNVTNKLTIKSTNKQPTNNQQITTNNNDNKEDNENNKEHDRFAEFWGVYPRKENRKKALAAFGRMTNKEIDLAIEDVKIRKESHDWKKDGGKFIPHPTSYINGKRWEDEKIINFTSNVKKPHAVQAADPIRMERRKSWE